MPGCACRRWNRYGPIERSEGVVAVDASRGCQVEPRLDCLVLRGTVRLGCGYRKTLEMMVDAIPGVKRGPKGRGRPRKRPHKLHADKGYDSKANREALRKRGITPRIARRGIESSEKLGKHRWVVERTLAWFNHFRRLTIRYERRLDIHIAFLELGSALICWKYLEKTFC